MITPFKLPDNGIPIRVGDKSYIYKNVYHPIEWFSGEPFRPRVETLVLDKTGTELFLRIKDDKSGYRIPGGSIDEDSTYEKQAENETNEEALMAITNLVSTNITYTEMFKKDFIKRGGDSPISYAGFITYVYIATYEGKIDRSAIEEKDLDDDMANYGKFYPIASVINLLSKPHIEALSKSDRVSLQLKWIINKRLDALCIDEGTKPVFEMGNDLDLIGETPYIYHGSIHKIEAFKPMSLDLGNGLQEPGWSTFCFRNYNWAKRFALMRLIQNYFDGGKEKNTLRKCGWDMFSNKPYVHTSVFEELCSELKDKCVYVYTINAENLDLGLGNDLRFPEVTFRESGIIPERKDCIYASDDVLRSELMILTDTTPDEFEEIMLGKIEELNRGWISCMINRNYVEDSEVGKLTKAVSDGKLRPGDDVNTYMERNGIVLKDISFVERLVELDRPTKKDTVSESFDISNDYEETIMLGDNKALFTSTEYDVYSEDKTDEKDTRFPIDEHIPQDSKLQYKRFLYRIHESGQLFLMAKSDFTTVESKNGIFGILRVFVRPIYRMKKLGHILVEDAICYIKTITPMTILVEVSNGIVSNSKIKNWIMSYGFTVATRTDKTVGFKLDTLILESYVNLSNFSYYRAMFPKPGHKPNSPYAWDEEEYCKDIESAIISEMNHQKDVRGNDLYSEDKFTLNMYTMGDECSSIYLGKVTVYNMEKGDINWEWEEQEDLDPSMVAYMKEEVQKEESLECNIVDLSNIPLPDNMIVEESLKDSTLLEPIFIVLTFTGTTFGKLITKFQNCKFSHSGIALNSKLNEIFTFNMRHETETMENRGKPIIKHHFTGGAYIESIDKYTNKADGGDADICVMCIFVEPSVKQAIKYNIDKIFSNIQKTAYGFGNVFNIVINRTVDTGNSMKMICSQFVDRMLKMVNIDITGNKSSNLVTPNDFAKSSKTNPNVFILFDGKKSGYSSKEVDKKVNYIRNSGQYQNINAVSEAEFVEESVMLNSYKKSMINKHVYHGSYELYDTLEPTGLDLGNKIEAPGWSLYTWKHIEDAIGWGIFQAIKRMNNVYHVIEDTLCLYSTTMLIIDKDIDKVIEMISEADPSLNHYYIYDITINSSMTIGLGHSSNTRDCITIKTPHIKYNSVDKRHVTKDDIFKYCKIVTEDELIKFKNGGFNHRHSWLLMNNDLMFKFVLRDTTLKTIKEAILSGELNPGDSIEEFMNEKGLKFDKPSFFERLMVTVDNSAEGIRKRHGIIESSVEYVEESVIFNKDNTAYNVDKFESGESNLLFVTGLSGSGKSTLAKRIASEYKAEWIELDNFEQCYGFTDSQLKEAGEVFFDYLSNNKSLWEKLKAKEIKGVELGKEIKKFVHYCISWCRERKDRKFVIEGVQIYAFLDSSTLKSQPVIIMGTSAKNSILRRFERNGNGKTEWGKEIKNEFPNLLAWYWGEEKVLKSFRKDMKTGAVIETVVLTEAEGDDELPSLGKDDKTEDYSAEAEKSVDDNQEDDENRSDKSTNDDENSDENVEDESGNPDDLDDELGGGSDYTEDAENSDTEAEDTSSDEPMDADNTQENKSQSNNNTIKNYSILRDFESLYRLASEISDTLEPMLMEKPIQNKVLVQVRENLSAIKKAITDFITLHFKASDYAFNLYYYEVFLSAMKKNVEILAKNKLLSTDNSKNKKNRKEKIIQKEVR